MDKSAIKKEDKRITVTYILCIAAIVFYTLLIWQEIQYITRVFLWSYSEYIWLDLLSFFLAIFTYILAILFYAALLGRKRSNTTKKITLLFLLFGIAYLCFYVIPMLIEFPIFSQNYTFPFYLGRMHRIFMVIVLIFFGILLIKNNKPNSNTTAISRYLFFIILLIDVALCIWESFLMVVENLFLLLWILEPIFLLLPIYLANKALADESFYQRFIAHY